MCEINCYVFVGWGFGWEASLYIIALYLIWLAQSVLRMVSRGEIPAIN